MTASDSLRRTIVFALLFGGAVGVLAWFAGGLRPNSSAPGEASPESPASTGPVAPLGHGLGIGESEDAVLRHDAVKVVDGKALRYRDWTAAWRKATPEASNDPEVGVQNIEAPKIVLFPEPSGSSAAEVAEGGPGSTRITATKGVLTHQKDVRTTARLTGSVLLERFDPKGDDLTLRTELLDCAIESHTDGTTETRRAQTTEPVRIDGGRAHIEGTGLDADLTGLDSRVTILANVKGRFEASSGFTGAGAPANGTDSPVDVTCSGACELVSLDTKARAADRRWRATFRDDVKVAQGGDTLTCDLLEVEFRANEPKEKGRLPADRIVATGHVRVTGRTETRTFSMDCEKATRTREGNVGTETDVVVFEGHPVMNVYGHIAAVRKTPIDPAAGMHERMEIRCVAPVVMRTMKAGNLATSPNRTNVVFEKDVVARRWDDDRVEKPTAELRAQKATLYGTRLGDAKFQPDTLTSELGVDIENRDFTSHSDTATWGRVAESGIDRYVLTGTFDRGHDGRPVVTYAGVEPLRTFGAAKAAKGSKITLTSDDMVQIDVYDDRPDAPGTPPRPSAALSAGPRVVMVQYDADDEVSRLTCDHLDATIAKGEKPQLQQVRAQGGAHVWGRGADGRQRDVYGTRILLDQLVLPPGSDPKAPHPARVTALGEAASPAVAVTRENDGRRHDVRAERLVYDQDASLLTATGHVVANLSGHPKEEDPSNAKPALAPGAVKLMASEARVSFAPGTDGAKDQSLRKVTATGDVVLDGGTSRATGRDVTYDAATGIAELTGPSDTAQLMNMTESTRYASTLNSSLIRVYFDTSGDAAKSGQIVRAACPGGGRIVRYFDPPDVNGKPVPGSVPRQLQVRSKGPIETTRTEATLTDDVAARMVGFSRSGEWTDEQATIYCDRAKITFDADAPGAAKDRMRTFVATGVDGRPVIAETPDLRAHADRADLDFQKNKLHLSTLTENDAWVRNLGPGGELSMFESGTYDYITKEWSDQLRLRAITETPPDFPGTRDKR